ncbi:MAG: hypothetical protein O2964_00625 [Verrucomicrobia bacterium]|nr:hypothetical protein [Verrucomicrobiota bacterium]
MRDRSREFVEKSILWMSLVALLYCAEATGADVTFMRFVKTGDREGHVDTAIQTYRHPAGVEVALVGAVHIGDKAYYDVLNERFKIYDSVLYEMIKDKEVDPAEISGSGHPVSQMQLGMKNMLGLDFQLEGIDYSVKNFVHADLDPATFHRLQGEKGENFFTLALQSFFQEKQMMASGQLSGLNGLGLLVALASSDREHTLKWMFAQQLNELEAMMAGIDQGMDGKGSVILRGRNDKAFQVLSGEIQSGKKRLAVFYGAGHMPDMDRRLNEMGFRRVREEWLVAWDLMRKG